MSEKESKKTNGYATAAFLIQVSIEQFESSPTLRKQSGVTLRDIEAAKKIKKRLVVESRKL